MYAFDWPKQTVKIYMQYSTYFSCNNDLCRAMLQDYLVTYSSDFCQLWARKRHLRRVTSAKRNQKYRVQMLAFDWLEQTVKSGCSILHIIFPARMTCAELCCQITWEHFPQLCVKFELWRRQLGTLFMTSASF